MMNRLVIVALALVALSFTLAVSGQDEQEDQKAGQKARTVENLTTGVEVEVLREHKDRSLSLRLKNVSDKNIIGFRFQNGEMGQSIHNMTESDEPERPLMAPGESYDYGLAAQNKGRSARVALVAVLYEDGTTEGEEREREDLKVQREQHKRVMDEAKAARRKRDNP